MPEETESATSAPEATDPAQGGSNTDQETQEPTEEDVWDITPTDVPPPEIYGQCKLPVNPAQDEDIDQSSGLRFGKHNVDLTPFTSFSDE